MIFVGIDIGTTRTKALVHDVRSGRRTVFARATPVIDSPEGDLRDAEAVLQTVLSVLAEAFAASTADDRARLAGIGVTSLSEEMVLVDADGRSLGPMPAWYNHEAGGHAAAEVGMDPSYSWAKLRWAHERITAASPPFSEVALDDIVTVTTLNGFVADRLADAGRFVVDDSHASRTGFFDVRRRSWHIDRFTETGWAADTLPKLVPTASIAGTLSQGLSARLGIASVPVVLAGHDHFCGAYGIGVRGNGQLYVSAGTSEAHCLIVDSLPDGQLPQGIGAGRFVDGERFYLHRQLPSGHLYQHWRRLLSLDHLSATEEAEALATRPVGAGGAVLVPGLDTDTRSWLLGVDTRADAVSVLRALFEGLACAARMLDESLSAVAGAEITAVLAAGIPSANPVWRELRAGLSPARLSVSDETEAPALGAAILAQSSLTGSATDLSSAELVPVDPATREACLELYEHFLRSFRALVS